MFDWMDIGCAGRGGSFGRFARGRARRTPRRTTNL